MTDTKNLQDDVTGMIAEFEKAKKAFQDQMQVQLKALFASFFQTHPEVVGICWEQYTPYFNDGDPCEFRVGDFLYTTSQETWDEAYSSYDLEGENGGELYNTYSSNQGEFPAAYVEFGKLLASIPDEVYEAMFGDHVTIKASRTGFDVSEYSHD